MVKSEISWEKYALEIAKVAAIKSKDPWVKVGCCILRKSNNSVASTGFNGAPAKLPIDYGDRNSRRPRTIHAESNAIKFASPYCVPGDCYLAATTLFPCLDCFKQLVNFGITKIVYGEESSNPEYQGDLVKQIAKEWEIELIHLLTNRISVNYQ